MDEQRHRRRGPDKLVKIITILSASTWFVLIFSFIIYTIAKPPQGSLFYIRNKVVGETPLLLALARILTFGNFFISISGISINTKRNKRKSDHFHFSLIISAVLSLIFFVSLMVFS